MKAQGLWIPNPIYLSSALKILSEGALCLRLFDDKSFWNIDLNVKLRGSREGISQCFSLLNPNFFIWGARREAEKEGGREGGRHMWGNICVCDSCERGTCVQLCSRGRMFASAAIRAFPCVFSERGERVAWFFLNHCKQARALLTMPLRVNAQNNFQLENPLFRKKSEFLAYYCRRNADPHSASARRWKIWQQLQIPFQTQWNTACVYSIPR